MRVVATAIPSATADALGQLELECSPYGLDLGIYELGHYEEGYAPGPLLQGTRVRLPWSAVKGAELRESELHLEFAQPSFPHKHLTLTRFVESRGTAQVELKRRRLLLHVSASGLGTLVMLLLLAFGPDAERWELASSAALYGLLTTGVLLGLGYSMGERFFLRPPSEPELLASFVSELERYFPEVKRPEQPPAPEEVTVEDPFPRLRLYLPRSTVWMAVALASLLLTALFATRDYLEAAQKPELRAAATGQAMAPRPASTQAQEEAQAAEEEPAAPVASVDPEQEALSPEWAAALQLGKRCSCERSRSLLFTEPLSKLSVLILSTETVQRKKHIYTELELAVVNNSATELRDVNLHLHFVEHLARGGLEESERPLYYEGPLGPGQAIKWSVEAPGTEYQLTVDDFGKLGPLGEGAANLADFRQLLGAKNRLVRLHALRALAYVGAPGLQELAASVGDDFRGAESALLERILAAGSELKVCELSLSGGQDARELQVCVHNSSGQEQTHLGLLLRSVSGKFEPRQPTAESLSVGEAVEIPFPTKLSPGEGRELDIKLPLAFRSQAEASLEIWAGRRGELR